MLISYKRSQTGVVVRFKILDSSETDGRGLTGLTNASSGLKIATIADNETSTTVYTVAGSNVEDITTLGTYQAPSSNKCRFEQVDATNHPGIYELHLANARYAVASAKSLLVSVTGATDAAECDFLIPLVDLDPYTSVGTAVSAITFSEPAGEALWGDSIVTGFAHLMAITGHLNKTYVTRSSSTAGTLTVRNFADDTTLWAHTLSDDGTTSTVGKAT